MSQNAEMRGGGRQPDGRGYPGVDPARRDGGRIVAWRHLASGAIPISAYGVH